MILKYIQLAFRQIQKDKTISLLNICGLAVGIATFTLLAFYLKKELSFDRYHDRAENICRIALDLQVGSQHNVMAWTSGALATHIGAELAEVTDAVRLFRYRSPSVLIEKGTPESFSEENFIWADSNVFNVFRFEFLKGDPSQALKRPNTMVISETTSRKYFGDNDPLGKVLSNVTFGADFEITGVIRDMPDNSHFKADLICSLNTLPKLWGEQMLTTWGNNFLYTYIRLPYNADRLSLVKKINALAQKNLKSSNDASYHFILQRLTDIHLHSSIQNEWQPNSDINYLYILTFVAILILLVSVINYVNLWIARSEQRTNEIGVRLAIGSGRGQLTSQFIVENLVHGILALVIGLIISGLFLPYINLMLGEDLHLPANERLKIWVITGIGSFLLMLIASVYPIQTILKIQPAVAIKGAIVKLRRGVGLWHSLIAFQMGVTTLLITGALLINRQLNFMNNKPLGYDAEYVLNITLLSDDSQRNYERLKNEVLLSPRVKAASACSHQVGGNLYQSGYIVYKDNGQEEVVWQRIHVDHDFCKTYGIDIVSGRDFSRASAADTSNFIINEIAVRHLGLENSARAIGLEIGYDNGLRGKIIGVMRDFHFKTLHTPVEPLIIHIVPSRFRMLSLNVEHADFQNTISWIRNKWEAFDPSSPFVYTLLGDFNEGNYVFEKKFSKLIIFFTLVVSVLSTSGMIGLNIYIVNLKKKEIGVRKVLGAGIQDLLFSLNRRFAIIAAIGFVLSVPISWFALNTWLSGFAYKVSLSAGLFIAAGVIMSVLCVVSVSIPSLRAAGANPARALKEN